MVAHTMTFCLPYFEPTDSPCVDTGSDCAPSTVWCDMAARINEVFTEQDEIVDRAVESFPYAQVAKDPFTFNDPASTFATTLVLWDSVLGDSDNMVDLTLNPSSVYLHRSGIWNIGCTVVWKATVAATDLQAMLLTPGPPRVPSLPFSFLNNLWVDPVVYTFESTGPVIGLSSTIDLFLKVDTTTGPAPLQVQLSVIGGTPGNGAIVEVCRFTARWVADLP